MSEKDLQKQPSAKEQKAAGQTDGVAVVNVKLEPDVLARIEAKRKEIQEQYPGLNPSNPEVVKLLILRK